MNRPPVASRSPSAAEALAAEIAATPESGRDPLVTARLHLLENDGSDRAARLLLALTTAELPGVRPSTAATLAATLHPSAVVKCLLRIPSGCLYQSSRICGVLRWEDALDLVAATRDAAVPPPVSPGFRDPLLATAFELAANIHLPYGHDPVSLRRSDGAEMLFLFGAARAPGELLAEISRLRITGDPAPNNDPDLARWAFANPGLTGPARAHALAQNNARVVATLREEDVLGPVETLEWLRSGDADEVRDRIVTVLDLPSDTPGVSALRDAALRVCKDVSQVASRLSPAARRDLAVTVTGTSAVDAHLVELVGALLPEWGSTPAALLVAASALHERGC